MVSVPVEEFVPRVCRTIDKEGTEVFWLEVDTDSWLPVQNFVLGKTSLADARAFIAAHGRERRENDHTIGPITFDTRWFRIGGYESHEIFTRLQFSEKVE